jgi:acetyltransferase-like isoleucine patch superfamily enzyme
LLIRDKLKRRFNRRNPNLTYPEYSFGKWTYGVPLVHNWPGGSKLSVGAFCSIAEGVQIFLGGEHRTDWVTTYPFIDFWKAALDIKGHPKTKGDVVIGNDVWIGQEALILSGVNIADGAVIGARSVVCSDVPPYHIVAGNPARIIKARFDPNTIQRLSATHWWDWEDARIEQAIPLMSSSHIEHFLDLYETGEI